MNKVFQIEVATDFSIKAYPIGKVVVFASTLEEAIDKIKARYNNQAQFNEGHYWVSEARIITEVGIE